MAGAESPTPPPNDGAPTEAPGERCEFCGSAELTWRKCKQVCLACGNINRSCADL